MTSSSFSIPTLANSTDYQCQIVTPSPTSEIFTSTIVTVTFGVVYCAPTVVRCDDGDTINSFILIGESGTKINDIETNCSINSYDNRTSQSVTLFNGMVYTALVSSQYSPGEQFAIWIDFNDNKVFESNETVTYGSLNSTYDTPVVLTIPIASSGGTPGVYRMRAVVAYGNIPNPCNPSYTYGETHDYTVNIISYTSCTSSFCQSTLLLSDTNTATVQTLVNNLQSSGLTVNYIPGGISSYTESPPASAYGSVILVHGDTYSADMPTSEQRSIVSAQQTSGTGVVMTEWAAYQVSNGRWSILSSLLLATLTTTSNGYVSYTLINTAHPIWTGVANSFGISTTITFAKLNTPTTGSIVQIGHYSGTGFNWGNDGNLLQMMRNAVRWVAKLI